MKILIICFALFVFAGSLSWASCGSSSCPIDNAYHEAPQAGNLRLDGSFQYINQSVPRVGASRASVGDMPNAEHNEVATINRVYTLRTDYELDSRWGFGLTLPLISRTHDHISVDSGDIEHWSFSGVGDVIAQIRYEIAPSLRVSLGGKFPTGRTGAHNDAEKAEITIQPGSGSYDAIFGAAFSQNLAKLPTLDGKYAWLTFFTSVSYKKNTPGTQNYRMGDEFLANLGSSYSLLNRLDLLAQANFRFKGKDGRGDTAEDTSFTGGAFLYLSPGLRAHWTKDLSTYGYVQLPVYQRVNQEQLTSAYNLLCGVTVQFGGF